MKTKSFKKLLCSRIKKCKCKEHARHENTTFRYLIFERKLVFSVPQLFIQDQGQRIKLVQYSLNKTMIA